MSLKKKIYLALSLLLVLGYGLFTYLSYSNAKGMIARSIENNLGNIAASNAEFIAAKIHDKLDALSGVAITLTKTGDDPDLVMSILTGAMTSVGSPETFIGYDRDGSFIDSVWVAPDDYDPRGRGWYKNAKAQGKPIVSDVYVNASSKKLVTTLAVPVYRDQVFIGVLGADVKLDFFEQRAADVTIPGGYISFLDNNGLVLENPNAKAVGKNFKESFPDLTGVFEKIFAAEKGRFNYLYGKEKTMMFDTVQGVDWKVLVSVERAEAYAGVHKHLRQSLLISVAATLVTLLVIVYVLSVFFKPLNRLGTMVVDLAKGEGDLTKRVEVTGNDEIAAIGKDVNIFIEQIQKTIKDINENSGAVDTSSEELRNIANSLLANTQKMSEKTETASLAFKDMDSNLVSVAAAMEQSTTNITMVAGAAEEMNATISQIAENMDTASSISQSAVKQAEDTSSQMGELGAAAQAISKITETITEISDKTNLLALNATIEAARAGESGKGFAVVAHEIKELAQQTAEATSNIRAQIDGVQATSLSSIGSIDEILKIINSINDIIGDVSAAVKEQSLATQEITDNINQASSGLGEVNENVSQSSMTSETVSRDIVDVNETSTAVAETSEMLYSHAESLQKLASVLKSLVNTFKV